MNIITRALLSVSDKTNLIPFARALAELGIEIVSTGGTASALAKEGIPVTPISDVTGFPEIMDGRVKTLHPKIHAGILAVRDNPEHMATLKQQSIAPIDLVVVNLYPFEKTIAKGNVPLDEAIENIDIGGPSMVRAAAKNYHDVVVVVNPARYDEVLEKIISKELDLAYRFQLMREAFAHTAAYDAAIAEYFESHYGKPDVAARETLTISFPKDRGLRYGENPHQHAALFGKFTSMCDCFHGKELSYNNILDATAAIRIAGDFTRPTAAIIKHTNPCGVSSHDDLLQAYRNAFATDTAAPFGGIVAVNRPIDEAFATVLNEIFLEILIAPEFTEGALAILKKKKDRRLMRVNFDAIRAAVAAAPDVRSVIGGVLAQDADATPLDLATLRVATKTQPTNDQMQALQFAWTVAKHVKSNAIVFARGEQTLGVGAGQMSRVDSVRLAIWKAHDMGIDLRNSVVASDAFFPFADNIDALAEAGASAVIQPGGSMRDPEVIAAADACGISMVFTGVRHFRH